MADPLGTIEAGKLADLVLDADPLADTANTPRIRAVVANGRLYCRADLHRLRSTVESAGRARASRPETTRLQRTSEQALHPPPAGAIMSRRGCIGGRPACST